MRLEVSASEALAVVYWKRGRWRIFCTFEANHNFKKQRGYYIAQVCRVKKVKPENVAIGTIDFLVLGVDVVNISKRAPKNDKER